MMHLASTVPRSNLAADAAATLSRAIQQNELSPGMRLPSEGELARQLGVSRPVVREAIAYLKADGIVESRHGLGLFVDRPTTLRLRVSDIEESEQSILEFLEFRLGLEAEAAQLAALRHDPDDLARIDEALRLLESHDAEGRDSAEQDLAFHLAVARAAHSPLFDQVLRFVAGPLLTSIGRMRARDAGDPRHAAIRTRDHRLVRDRIAAFDAAGAGDAMRHHINESYRRYAAQMTASPAGPRPHPALNLRGSASE